MEQFKAASARQVFFNDLKIDMSFTLECSFFMKHTAKMRHAQITHSFDNLESSVNKTPQNEIQNNSSN